MDKLNALYNCMSDGKLLPFDANKAEFSQGNTTTGGNVAETQLTLVPFVTRQQHRQKNECATT